MIEFLAVLIDPLITLILILLVFLLVIKPFFRYLAVNKEIKEQRELRKEYLERKEKIKRERLEHSRKSQAMFLGEQSEE